MIEVVTQRLLCEKAEIINPLLEEIADTSFGFHEATLIEGICSGATTGWLMNDKALGITEIHNRPLQRVLFISWLAGDNMDEWLAAWLSYLEDYARITQCVAIEFVGRIGFERKFVELKQQFPFRAERVAMRMEID